MQNSQKNKSNIFFTSREDRDYNKVFVIGMGKTGTTTLEKILTDIGFTMGNQAAGEMLIKDYRNKEFDNIIKYFHSAEAFQDCPSCLPELYKIIDKEFPNSKFILTIRDSADEWYDSLVRFHTKIFSSTSNHPSCDDLRNADYRYRSWALHAMQACFDYPRIPLYEPIHYKSVYNLHNNGVQDYFRSRKDLLAINLKEDDCLSRLCNFLGFTSADHYEIPHLNQSR
jgi:hypothetical protein